MCEEELEEKQMLHACINLGLYKVVSEDQLPESISMNFGLAYLNYSTSGLKPGIATMVTR